MLRLGSIVGFDVGVRLVLQCAWDRVFKTGQCLGKIAGHHKVDLPSFVIPFYGNSAIAFPFPAARAFVILSHRVYQTLHVLLANILYPKIVDNEGEADGSGVMFPETGGCLALTISMLFEAFFEKLLGDDTSLW